MGTTLAEGGFRGSGDAASKTLLGPRGIGKTTALKAYAAVAPLIEPHLVPIYLSYVGLGQDSGVEGADEAEAAAYIGRSTLLVMVADALEVRGIYVSPNLDSIVDGLERHGKYALLLVDELDKFYESQGDASHADNVGARFRTERKTLGQLAALGNDPCGRIAVLLCGSSSLLGDLVTTNLRGASGATDLFPVLQVAIDLNGQKFRAQRVTFSPPTDFEAVASMLRRLPPASAGVIGRPPSVATAAAALPEFDAIVNSVLFCAGATARNVARLVAPKTPLSASDLTALFVDESPQASRTLHRASSKALWDGLMGALRDKNAALLARLVTAEGGLDFHVVAAGGWRKLQPLSWGEVLGVAGGIPALSHGDIALDVAYLFDRDYIAFGDGMEDGHPCAVYPYSVMQLLKCGKTGDTLRTDTVEPIVSGLNSLRLAVQRASITGGGIRDGVVREMGKDLYGAVKESLRDIAARSSSGASGAG
jgi:hypothetical protein